MEDNKKEIQYRDNRFSSFLKIVIIALVDLALFSMSYLFAATQSFKGLDLGTYNSLAFSYLHFIIIGVIIIAVNYAFGLYRSVWHFAGIDEVIRGVIAAAIDTMALFAVDRILFEHILHYQGHLVFWRYIIVFIFATVSIIAPRLAFRAFRRLDRLSGRRKSDADRIMIVGAGFMGNFVIDALANDHYKNGIPIIAVDDNPVKLHKKINGVKVAGTCAQIPELAEKYNIDQIIICLPSASQTRQKEILNLAMQTEANVKISPTVEDMLEEGGKRRIRNVEISDLLARDEVKLDKKVCRYLIGETILVTGGGGSIGAEICNQVARYNPKCIIIFDIYENCAFELQNELNDKYKGDIDINVRIGSVRDMDRLREVFEEFHPDVVFHAAAHKHVPLMEDSPCEAVKNNVFGTYNVALVADEFKVHSRRNTVHHYSFRKRSRLARLGYSDF